MANYLDKFTLYQKPIQVSAEGGAASGQSHQKSGIHQTVKLA
jgi:hypothetical protein